MNKYQPDTPPSRDILEIFEPTSARITGSAFTVQQIDAEIIADLRNNMLPEEPKAEPPLRRLPAPPVLATRPPVRGGRRVDPAMLRGRVK